jgi:phenylpyruvate tautomerase PptA (4-oxalocrotonate tautomerase family)
MPIAHVHITGPKPASYKRALIEGTMDAIIEGLSSPADHAVVRLSEADPECMGLPESRSDRFVFVEVFLYEGRSDQAKRAFARLLRGLLAQEPGIESSDVAIALHDMTRIDLDVLPGRSVDRG